MRLRREEYEDNGYIRVIGVGDKDTLVKYCKGNRYILMKIVDIDTLLYEEVDDYERVVMTDIEDKEERDYLRFRLGVRIAPVEVIGVDANPKIDFFIKREKEYSANLKQRGRDRKAMKGAFLGGVAPYGYYVFNKKLYIDDYESFIVKFVFYRRSQNCSYYGIAKELNIRGFRNRKKETFKPASIKSIEENKRLYQGYFSYKGEEVKGDFRGILEDNEELLTKEWVNRVFDAETEAKISEHRKRYHSEESVPREIKPYIVKTERGKKIRRRR